MSYDINVHAVHFVMQAKTGLALPLCYANNQRYRYHTFLEMGSIHILIVA